MKDLMELEYEYSQMFEGNLNKYPEYWFESTNIELKKKVLKKAISEKKLIIDVSDDFVEGVFIE